MNQLRNYLKTLDEWTPVKSKKELAEIDDTAGIYFATYNKCGRNGKEPYAWLDIKYRGLNCSISTVWEDVDITSKNIHHYFGQICFIKYIMHNVKKCPSPNIYNATIKDIHKRCKIFKSFLNKYKYKTVNQTSAYTELTIDNFLDASEDNVTANKVITLFEHWANQQICTSA